MSEQFDPNVYDDSGEWIGVYAEAEDGAAVLIDGDGDIVAAVDPYAQPLDPGAYEVAMPEPEPEPAPGPGPQHEGASPYSWEQAADEQWAQGALRTLEQFERDTGRTLSQREAHQILGHLWEDHQAGVQQDVPGAFLNAGLADHGTHEGRVQAMSERLADVDRDERGADPDDFRPPRRAEEYDLSTHDGRASYTEDRLAGYDDCDERTTDDISVAQRGDYDWGEEAD
jgi:hypothetical protein